MRLFEIMSKDVHTASPAQSVTEALEEMRRRNIHHLVVVENGRAVGIVSSHDRGDGQAGREVRDVMHAPVVTAPPATTVREAANILRGRTIGCLPVSEDGRLVGIVTTSDLLELLGRGVERPVAESKRWTLGRRQPRPPAR
jgi:acetoin utilization protein AcuB